VKSQKPLKPLHQGHELYDEGDEILNQIYNMRQDTEAVKEADEEPPAEI